MKRSASQTFLAHADRCLHSAMLYERHKHDGPSSHPKDRGTATHLVAERIVRLLIEQGEGSLYAAGHSQGKDGAAVPEDEATAKKQVASFTETLVHEVRAAHPELQCTTADWDKVRLMAFHIAAATPVDPSRVVAVERMFEMDVLGWTVRGKLDVVTITGESAEVTDWKTQLHVPDQESFEDAWQNRCYAALLVFGQPVTKVPCPNGCGLRPDMVSVGMICEACSGDRFVWRRDPGIGDRLGWVKAREVYPRYLRDDGTLAQRDRTLTRTEINDFRIDLEALVARVDESLRTEHWPAVPGHHCFQCPSVAECPLPEEFRGPRGSQEGLPLEGVSITTPEEAAAAAEKWLWLSEGATALKKAIRGYAKGTGVPVRFGRDLELSFRQSTKRTRDHDAHLQASEDADRRGAPRPPIEAYTSESVATSFVKRRLSAAELRAEAETVELSADEKWGETAPW